MTNDDLLKCQASSAAAIANLPELVKTSSGALGFLDNGTMNTNADELFARMNEAKESLIEANDLIQAETPRAKRDATAATES